ncbi:MAG: hypothetical protein AB7T74_11905 [Clostridia bacterium]|nr:hypothetical protein [Spirochaetia bacterium]
MYKDSASNRLMFVPTGFAMIPLGTAGGIGGLGDGPIVPFPWLSLTYRIR